MAKKTPAKSKAKPKKKDETETPSHRAVGNMISQNDLKNLLRRCTTDANQIGTINGTLRERIADAVEKKHLDKKAFALLRRLDKMENEDLATFWDNFLAYMDMAGLNERIESVGKLPLPEPTEKENEEQTEGAGVSRPRLAAVAGAQVD